MIERTPENNQLIQAYGLDVFLADVQELVLRGYVLDFKNNAHFPQQIGHLYVATMVTPPDEKVKTVIVDDPKPAEIPVITPELEALQAIVEEGKRPGRKPKVTA